MIKTLKDTTAAEIQAAITDARRNVGSASGMVFTMIVLTGIRDHAGVLDSCTAAGREHPSRILVLSDGTANADRLDAEVHVGEDVPGEIVTLRFHGRVAEQRESVVLPLLLPDSPVVAWWPGNAPSRLADDPVGRLASRRISDAMGASNPLHALADRAAHLSPGDTDLTWTRLTPWRGLLAASLDQVREPVERIVVSAERGNAAAILLAAWLADRIGCEVVTAPDDGPGINSVTLTTPSGDIRIARTDGQMATFSAPGTPCRSVALRRRSVTQLLTEELRRMDPDVILASAMAQLHERGVGPLSAKGARRE